MEVVTRVGDPPGYATRAVIAIQSAPGSTKVGRKCSLISVSSHSLSDALYERRERGSAIGCLIDQALAPFRSVAAASQGLSLHRS